MAMQEATKSFTPREPPKLNPPKDDPIDVEELAKCDGMALLILLSSLRGTTADSPDYAGTNEDHPTYVAIKGTVFDVSANKAYAPKGSYHGMFVTRFL